MVGEEDCATVDAKRINQILMVDSIVESAGISSRVLYKRYGYEQHK